MAKLVFHLNGVPEDEAQDVRDLLDEHHIDYYETPAGRWGISLAAIWLPDETQLTKTRELFDAYQQQRYQQARQDYEQRKADGLVETGFSRLLKQPLQVIFYLLAILAVLYISIAPFLP